MYVTIQPILTDSEWATLVSIKLSNYRIKLLVDCGLSDGFNCHSIKKLLMQSIGIKYIFLTHSTLEHVGGLPFLMRKYTKLRNKPQIICTDPTYKLAKANLLDLVDNMSLNLPKSKLHYSADEINSALSNSKLLRYDEHITLDSAIDGLSLHVINSGHSVGGSAYVLTMGTKQILIARKISLISKWHLNSLSLSTVNNPYLLITDFPKLSINACLLHSSLDMVIHKTINTLKNGNCVLLPIDIDSRMVELLHHFEMCWKSHYVAKWPLIIASPIVSKMSLIFSTSIEYMSSKVKSEFSRDLKNPLIFDNVIYLDKLEQLKPFTNVPCVIFSTPGSLNWGFSNALFAAIGSKKGNLIILSKEPTTKTLARKLSLYTSKVDGSTWMKVNTSSDKGSNPNGKQKSKRNKFSWLFRFRKPLSVSECYELYKQNQLEIDSEINTVGDNTMKIDEVSMENDICDVTHELNTGQSFYGEPQQTKNKLYSIISSDPLGHLKFNKLDNSSYPTFSDKISNPVFVNVTSNAISSAEDDYGLVNQFAELWKSQVNKTGENDKKNVSVDNQQIGAKTDEVEDMMDLGQKCLNTQSHDTERYSIDTPLDYYLKLYKSQKNINNTNNTKNNGLDGRNGDSGMQNDWMNSLIRWFGKMPSQYVKKRIRQCVRAKVIMPIGLENTIDQYSLYTLISKLKVKKVCLLPLLHDNKASVANKNLSDINSIVSYKYKIPSPMESLVECSIAISEEPINTPIKRDSNTYIFDKILDNCSREARKKFRQLNLKVKFNKINEGPEPRLSFWQSKQPCLYAMCLAPEQNESQENSTAHDARENFYSEVEHQFPNIPIFKVAETFNQLLPGQISVVGRHSAIVIASKTVVQRVEDNGIGTIATGVKSGLTDGKKWILRGTIDPTYYLARKTLYALHGNPF